MAEELKHHSWKRIDKAKSMRKLRYPYHWWFNGSTWLLRQGEDFDGNPDDFRRYLFTICRYHDFWIDTAIHRNQRDLYVRFVKPRTERWKKQLSEWELRWYWQHAWGADGWWIGQGSFEEYRMIREFHEMTTYSRKEAWRRMQQEMSHRFDLIKSEVDSKVVREYAGFLKSREQRGYPLYHEWLEEEAQRAEGEDQEAAGVRGAED
jgi:hypothetical protein